MTLQKLKEIALTILAFVGLIILISTIYGILSQPVVAQDRVSHVDGPYIPRRPLTAPQAPVGPKSDVTVTIGRISSLQSAGTDTIRLRTYHTRDRSITTGRIGRERIFLEERKDPRSD